jgi:hypothetical protein
VQANSEMQEMEQPALEGFPHYVVRWEGQGAKDDNALPKKALRNCQPGIAKKKGHDIPFS